MISTRSYSLYKIQSPSIFVENLKKIKILRWISFGCWVLGVNTMLMGRCLWKHSQSHRIFLVYIYTPPKNIFIVQKMKGEKEKSQSSAVFLDPPSAGKMSLSCSVFHTGVLLHKVGSTAHTLAVYNCNKCLPARKKKEGGDQRKKLPSMIVQETLLVSNRVQFTRWSIDAVWDTRDTNESEGKKGKRNFLFIPKGNRYQDQTIVSS